MFYVFGALLPMSTDIEHSKSDPNQRQRRVSSISDRMVSELADTR
jgi:hypothetical protein